MTAAGSEPESGGVALLAASGGVARLAAAALVVALAVGTGGCASRTAPEPDSPSALRIGFADAERPEVYAIRAPAAVAAEAEGAGLWASVPGLPRPERARVRHPRSGHAVDVALYRGDRPGVRLSAEAAARLGVAADGALVEIVALRSQPRIEAVPTAF